MNIITTLGIILITGYFFGLIAEKLSLPRVTSYLLAGVLYSEELLGHILDLHLHLWADTFSQICLGFIAYIIGSEIKLENFKKSEKNILLGTFFESLVPVGFVFISTYLVCDILNLPSILSIVLSSVASTTAPAATVAVIEQYKSKGEMTNTTLGIVALDDAFGVIIFTLISIIFYPNGDHSFISVVFNEILLSILIGIITGYSLSHFTKLSESNDFLFVLLSGLVLLIVALSNIFHFNSLLTLIILGFMANNTNIVNNEKVSLFLPIEHIQEFIFVTFFTFAGSHFSLKYFQSAFILILTYTIARALGKYFGAYTGLTLAHAKNPKTKKWIGLTLLPQAGVAIGLLLQATQTPQLSEHSELLINTILGSTIIYEVLGPILSKWAFTKTNEINPAPR